MLGSLLIFLLSIATVGVSLTGAVFTDSQSVGSNTFSTGTVDVATTPTTAIVSLTGIAPGDEILDQVAVSNDGSLELRYAVTSTSDATDGDFLAAQLDLVVWDEAQEAGLLGLADVADTCEEDPTNVTPLYSGVLGSTTGTNVIGDPTQGSHTGDRTLAASASEVLCFHVSLPLSTGDAYQDASTTATFAFEAEQTANNS